MSKHSDEPMTDAEFKVMREFLGVSGDWMAYYLDVSPRTIRHWEAGTYTVPDGVRDSIHALVEVTEEFVRVRTEKLLDVVNPRIVTYRSDEEFQADPENAGIPFSASWHRAAVARITQQVPGLSIVYAAHT